MVKSEQIDALAVAMSATQSEIVDVVADKKAEMGKFSYRYADLGAVLEMARPIWTRHGLAIVQFPVSSDTGKIGVETLITHTSGQWMSSVVEFPIEGDGRMSMSQAAGSIITYARRYSLTALLAIAQVDEDAPPPGKPEQESGKSTVKPKAEPADWKPAAMESIIEKVNALLDATQPTIGCRAVSDCLGEFLISITPEEVGLRDEGVLAARLDVLKSRDEAGKVYKAIEARIPKKMK